MQTAVSVGRVRCSADQRFEPRHLGIGGVELRMQAAHQRQPGPLQRQSASSAAANLGLLGCQHALQAVLVVGVADLGRQTLDAASGGLELIRQVASRWPVAVVQAASYRLRYPRQPDRQRRRSRPQAASPRFRRSCGLPLHLPWPPVPSPNPPAPRRVRLAVRRGQRLGNGGFAAAATAAREEQAASSRAVRGANRVRGIGASFVIVWCGHEKSGPTAGGHGPL